MDHVSETVLHCSMMILPTGTGYMRRTKGHIGLPSWTKLCLGLGMYPSSRIQ